MDMQKMSMDVIIVNLKRRPFHQRLARSYVGFRLM